jgi:branched-chain amino acid transport system permease protein
MGKLHGAVLGAFAYVLLQEFLSAPALLGAYAKHWQLGMGSLIVLVVLVLPDGLAGLFDRHSRLSRRSHSNSTSVDLE